MPRKAREPFQRHRHLALGLGLSQVVMVPSKVVAVMDRPSPSAVSAHGPQRGNALGLPLADWKCGQAERGYQ